MNLQRLGLVAVLISGALLTYQSTQVGPDLITTLTAKHRAGVWPLATFVALGLVAVNLGVAGTLTAVTGARGLSLAHAPTRKGFIVMWAGADALVLGVLAGNVVEGRDDVIVEWADGLVLVAYVLVGFGLLLLRTGWKYDVLGAADVMATDPRPPVVYLRSFQDDGKAPVGGVKGAILTMAGWFMPTSFEQELAVIMNRIGPFVAIGRPGERLPELGANRFYFRDDEWRARVSELIAGARLTIILCGPTPNLWWEIDYVFASISPRRVLLIVPERGERTRLVERQLEERLRRPGLLHCEPPRRAFVAWLLSRDQTLGKVVSFSEEGVPTIHPLRQGSHLRAFLKTLSRPFSVYAAPLDLTFNQVFAAIDVAWRPPGPTRAMAIVLAMTCGWFGGHLFYLGDRRRGLRYLAFFWTTVPLFFSLRDAARLVLMDRRQFDQAYDRPASDRES